MQVDTMLGYGWTHSYNIFLFSQRGHMFRMDGDGRVIKYRRQPGGTTFSSTPGYFETLIQNPNGTFTLIQKDQTRLTFAQIPNTPFVVNGPAYRLTSIEDRNHNLTRLDYTNGDLTLITDTYGRSLTLSYDSQHKLRAITVTADPQRTTTLQYDSTSRKLLSITDPEGKSIHYSYNFLYQITRKVDRDGRTFSYIYSQGKPVAIVDGAGTAVFRLSNSTNWATDAVILARDLIREYVPSTISKTDGRGNVWKYDYDRHGLVTQVIAPDGATTIYL